MIQKQLEEVFGVSFTEVADITALRQFHHSNAYCLGGKDDLFGICVVDSALKTANIPGEWQQLTYLNLSGNKELEVLRFERGLSALIYLDVSDTVLKTCRLPSGFTKLHWLDISRNQLQHFIVEGTVPALCHLDLSNNALLHFSAFQLEQFPKLERLYLKGNPLDSTQIASVNEEANCLPFMQRYLRELNKGVATNKDYKLIVVGNGGVGKSTLVERMVHDSFRKVYDSTQGIVLKTYDKQSDDFILNIWDFGGQDIYHATHRLFMRSDALYLLLWDEESLNNPSRKITENGTVRNYKNYSLEYWLHYIRQQGGQQSPVIVVKTKEPTNNDWHPSREKLATIDPQLLFTRIDSEPDDWHLNGFRRLLGDIENYIGRRPAVKFGKNWYDLRQHLRDLRQAGKKTLTIDEYQAIAGTYDVEAPMKVLQNWLVASGEVFYRSGYFNDSVLLDQGWALHAIYAIFDRNSPHFKIIQETQKGCFSGTDLREIWQDWQGKKYTEAEQELFVSFMLGCQMCFELREDKENEYHHLSFAERRYVAPQLMPEEMPETVRVFMHMSDAKSQVHVRYEHDFLHYGVIQSFIIRAQQKAEVEDIWQDGILIRTDHSYVLVQVVERPDAHAGEKTILVTSHRDNLALFDQVRNTLEELKEGIVTEWASLNGEDYVSLNQLRECREEHIVTENGGVVKVADYAVFLANHSEEKMALPEVTIKKVNIENKTKVIKEQGTILFLAANPINEYRLEVDREFRRLKEQFMQGRQRDNYRFLQPQFGVTLKGLLRAMNDNPTIVHFSGHGLEDGIIVATEDNKGQIIPMPALQRLFRSRKGKTEIVILNACYSARQAEEISKFGMYVIGNNNPIEDLASISFSTGLYNGLGEGKYLRAAFDDAMIIILTEYPSAFELIEVWKDGQRLEW